MNKPLTCICLLALLPIGSLHAAECTLGLSDFNFGEYSAYADMPLDGAGQVVVRCTSSMGSSETVNYTLSLSGSNRAVGAMMRPRLLIGPGAPMEYNLYIEPGRITVWGDGSNGTQAISGSVAVQPMGDSQGMNTVYGRIPAQQPSIAPGEYNDTLTVTISY